MCPYHQKILLIWRAQFQKVITPLFVKIELGVARKLIGNSLPISAIVCKVNLSMNLLHIGKFSCPCFLPLCLCTMCMAQGHPIDNTSRGVANGGGGQGGQTAPPDTKTREGEQKSGRGKRGKGKKKEGKEEKREKGRKKREKEKRKGKRKRGRKREKGKERKREEKKREKGRKGGEEKGGRKGREKKENAECLS